jgi:hypothetical protein
VLREGHAHDMLTQRYDIIGPGLPGEFVRKTWSPVNSPVADDYGRVAGVLNITEDITGLADLICPPPCGPGGHAPGVRSVLAAARAAARHQQAQAHLIHQNRQLRDALMTMAASRQPGTRAAERRQVLSGQIVTSIGTPAWAYTVCTALAGVAGQPAEAALSLRARPAPENQDLLAATGDWARLVEDLHYTTGEGPAADAFTTGIPVLVPDLSAQQQAWPGFISASAGTGLAAAFAFPLQIEGPPLGTLTLYSRDPHPVDQQGLADAAVLADLATTALLADLNQGGPLTQASPATAAALQQISLATGMLAASLRVSTDEALTRMRAYAYAHGRVVTDVASAIVSGQLKIQD